MRVNVTCCGRSWPFEYHDGGGGHWREVRDVTPGWQAEMDRRIAAKEALPLPYTDADDYNRRYGRGAFDEATGLHEWYAEDAPRVSITDPELPVPTGLRWIDEREHRGPDVIMSSTDRVVWYAHLQTDGWPGIGSTFYTMHYERHCTRCDVEVRTPVTELVVALDKLRAAGQDSISLAGLNWALHQLR